MSNAPDTEITPNRRDVSLSPHMRTALMLDDTDRLIAGNVASHAIRATYATDNDPFAGMNIGWVDETESVLDFLVGIVEDVDERVSDGTWDGDESSHEVADSRAAMHTRGLFECAAALHPYMEDPEIVDPTNRDAAGYVMTSLYETARQIADALAGAMIDARDHDEEVTG